MMSVLAGRQLAGHSRVLSCLLPVTAQGTCYHWSSCQGHSDQWASTRGQVKDWKHAPKNHLIPNYVNVHTSSNSLISRHFEHGKHPLRRIPYQDLKNSLSVEHGSKMQLKKFRAMSPALGQDVSTSSPSRAFHSLRRPQQVFQPHPLLNTRHGLVSTRRPISFTTSILESSPQSVKPYLRLIRFDKPIGTYLLYWPCTWSIAMAADPGHLPDPYFLVMFGAGSFLMRGAGCIINDMWDKDFDKMVERTKTRPLASGELSSFQALALLGTQLGLALGILLQFNTYSILLGAASMGLVITYPLAKRYTYWPQLMLGFTFNYGVLFGWSAVKGYTDWSVLVPMYAGSIAWTLIYDTIYAHQDKYDDMLIGVKSSALKLGDQTKPWLAGFSSLMVSGLTLSGYLCDQTWPFYVGVAATAAHLTHQLYTVDLDNPDDCAAKFRSNTQIGVIMFIAIMCGTLLREDKAKLAQTDTRAGMTP
ncbi:4-hydroxybenzoate polyprenyltransferase, mitochondrial-like isoform X1 [Haliotis rufescens]|uniref:4-hydroxybenzoate polyprenyltransferase, mitochondrial-like isoform X1 n=1 Tax=Haliotis rufescens TaxID=6454 RepID=UPI00201F03E9|nr:4-hydroxybenzoate polyprenyltransferase, mitochondrial-like isoform X1 [Haliotis rufescens]